MKCAPALPRAVCFVYIHKEDIFLTVSLLSANCEQRLRNCGLYKFYLKCVNRYFLEMSKRFESGASKRKKQKEIDEINYLS